MSRSWVLYGCLLVVRVLVGSILPGYIHPDEFYQGGQELFFGCDKATIAWEFLPENAVRSIVPPYLMTWVPLKIYSWLAKVRTEEFSGLELLVVPRIFCGLLSLLLIEGSLVFLSRSQVSKTPTPAMWIIATSWPAWVIICRPFTNGLETMWLSLLLVLVLVESSGWISNILLGLVCALGIFTRFTFAFFAVPAMLLFLTRKLNKRVAGLCDLICFAASAFLTSVIIILMDVNFYHAINSWTYVITPLNALLYNSKVTNLETHGLHPRYTHVLVNMSLLFGPMTLCFYKKLVDSMRRPALMKQSCITSQLCMGTVVSGLLLLSLAPHQEPRFLAPLLVPLSILTAEQVWKPRFRPLWIGFNLMLLTIYGVLHQGGVVPSLMSKAVTRDGPSSILYYRTYMPPSFLLRRECQTMVQECFMGSCVGSPPLIDLAGSSPYELRRILELNLKCEKEPPSFIYLVAPHVDDEVHMSSTKGCKIGYDYTCQSIWTVRPHLTTEDFPSFQTSFGDFLNSFELTIYNVSCKSAGDSE